MFTQHLAIREMRTYGLRLMQTHQSPQNSSSSECGLDLACTPLASRAYLSIFTGTGQPHRVASDGRDGIGAHLTIPVTRSPRGVEIRRPYSGYEQ
jgi:hypothetical protein